MIPVDQGEDIQPRLQCWNDNRRQILVAQRGDDAPPIEIFATWVRLQFLRADRDVSATWVSGCAACSGGEPE